MPGKKPEDLFNECLEGLLAGQSAEECLQKHPEAAGLRPLLEVSQGISDRVRRVEPRPEFVARVMVQAREALHARSQRRGFFATWQPRWATAVAAVFVLLVVGSVSVVASGTSEPDGFLYPLKLTTEQARMALTLSQDGKAELRGRLAETRVEEIAYLARQGDTARIEGVLQNLESNLGVPVADQAAGVVKASPAAPAPAAAPSVAPRSTPSLSGEGSAPPSPTSTVGAPAPSADVPVAGGAAPKNPLAGSRQRSLTILQEALKSAPESARPALEQAIARIRRAYEAAERAAANKPG